MGRRELQEHREQLRDGKKWLENMLAKTDKMLNMVENKIALAPSEATKHSDDWEFEERERARAKEIERLEAERERDRAEREKRERDRLAERERHDRERVERERMERERDHLGGGIGTFFSGRDRSLAALQRERSEAERNRDLLLASRRVTAVSPNGRERSTPGAATGAATGAAPGTTANGSNGASVQAGQASTGGAAGAAPERKSGPGGWDGEPVMAGVAMPRRDQALRLGRGLWNF